MRICNWLNSAIVSQMLKKHKKIEIMTYIIDNQSFTLPKQISCQTLSLRGQYIRESEIRTSCPLQSSFSNLSEGVLWTNYAKESVFDLLLNIPWDKISTAKGRDAMHRVSLPLNTCQRHPFGINTSTHFKPKPYNYDE